MKEGLEYAWLGEGRERETEVGEWDRNRYLMWQSWNKAVSAAYLPSAPLTSTPLSPFSFLLCAWGGQPPPWAPLMTSLPFSFQLGFLMEVPPGRLGSGVWDQGFLPKLLPVSVPRCAAGCRLHPSLAEDKRLCSHSGPLWLPSSTPSRSSGKFPFVHWPQGTTCPLVSFCEFFP